MSDKNIEIKRYNARAADIFNNQSSVLSKPTPLYLRFPETHYRKMLSDIRPSSKVLEIGAGTGENT